MVRAGQFEDIGLVRNRLIRASIENDYVAPYVDREGKTLQRERQRKLVHGRGLGGGGRGLEEGKEWWSSELLWRVVCGCMAED